MMAEAGWVLVGAALTSLAIMARSSRRIRELARATRALAQGETNARAPAAEGAFGELAKALNDAAATHAQALAGLRAERDLLAGILESMGEGVLVLDAHERIVLVNRALRTLARLDDEPAGKPLLEVIRNASLKEIIDAAHAEPVVREIELGRPLPRKLLARVSRLASSAATNGTIAVFHDVTDLRRLETIRTDFVANVSHELRTPVTAISIATETLLGGALNNPTEAAEFASVIERHSKRLRQLVDDLLDLAKIEAKSFRLMLIPLEVRPIIEHAMDLMQDAARRRKMRLTLAPGSEGLLARADRRGLEQALTNLLDNAIKYAGEGAHVTIEVTRLGHQVAITVADTGVGISKIHRDRIFERFYRVDAGRSRELGGTGLGLSIVKHLMELMGGSVDVESEPGKGARFTLRLPAPTPVSSWPLGDP